MAMKPGKGLMSWILVVLMAGLISACSREQPAEPVQEAATELWPLVGDDRDEHGCIGSAGYSWCAKRAECVRPWELARAEGFEVTEEAYMAYCGNAL